MTVWLFGTSVSIQRSGWTGRLAQRIDEPLANLSIGDQTSIMGLARLSQVVDQFQPNDVVVWEYPLLDILLLSCFGVADIMRAMRQAWHMARAAGAHVIVVFFTPKPDLAEPSAFEEQIKAAAVQDGAAIVDVRKCFPADDDPARHYKDIRHLHIDSPVLDVVATGVLECIASRRASSRPASPGPYTAPYWRWWSVGLPGAGPQRVLQSSLVSVRTTALQPGREDIELPPHRRLVCVVVASDDRAGALWCGHQLCLPASCKKPEHLSFQFLLRVTRIPCVRGRIERLSAAPRYSLSSGSWVDFGMAPAPEPGPVDVVGVLLEESPAAEDK
jgi:hypothetical protein